jgi:CheY-like chemotaxis protein
VPHRHSTKHPILVVEDHSHVRTALIDLLKVVGRESVPATNGIQALRALEDGLEPSVILLDLELPFLSGWILCKRLHADALFSRFPVIVISGHDVPGAQARGARFILQKPVNPEALLDAIEACMSAATQSSPAEAMTDEEAH